MYNLFWTEKMQFRKYLVICWLYVISLGLKQYDHCKCKVSSCDIGVNFVKFKSDTVMIYTYNFSGDIWQFTAISYVITRVWNLESLRTNKSKITQLMSMSTILNT